MLAVVFDPLGLLRLFFTYCSYLFTLLRLHPNPCWLPFLLHRALTTQGITESMLDYIDCCMKASILFGMVLIEGVGCRFRYVDMMREGLASGIPSTALP